MIFGGTLALAEIATQENRIHKQKFPEPSTYCDPENGYVCTAAMHESQDRFKAWLQDQAIRMGLRDVLVPGERPLLYQPSSAAGVKGY